MNRQHSALEIVYKLQFGTESEEFLHGDSEFLLKWFVGGVAFPNTSGAPSFQSISDVGAENEQNTGARQKGRCMILTLRAMIVPSHQRRRLSPNAR